jgi:hypothetical protein
MKKARKSRDTLRSEYTRSDFPSGLVRGKYAKRVAEGTNIVRLDPEIAAAFPTSEAVNEALGTVLKAARTCAGTTASRDSSPSVGWTTGSSSWPGHPGGLPGASSA